MIFQLSMWAKIFARSEIEEYTSILDRTFLGFGVTAHFLKLMYSNILFATLIFTLSYSGRIYD